MAVPTPLYNPAPTDNFPTATSNMQGETEHILLKHLPAPGDPAPSLQKNAHMQFLVRNLVQGFPARYTSQDASQPWLLFWTLQAFSVLQVGLDPGNKQRAIDTIMAWQHPKGGFGGGPGQAPHLLPTYAAVCSLAIVGRPGPGGGWDQIDREKMHEFFMSLKQPDGSFLVAEHAEVDVRGTYCLLITALLLDILTPELAAGTPSFLASCQTYEGGFASASHPSFAGRPPHTLLETPRPPLGEAHGGYTFCALASWVVLQPFLEAASAPSSSSSPSSTSTPQQQPGTNKKKPSINLQTLLRWLSTLQGAPSSLGGFRGRTNKLVDGCYAWWCGGSFALLEALGVGGVQNAAKGLKGLGEEELEREEEREEEVLGWVDVDDELYDQKALQEYILYAGQHPAGGLRDKPPKNADAYHTLYCLSGLSSAQHHVFPSSARQAEIAAVWYNEASSGSTSSTASIPKAPTALRKELFSRTLSWMEEEGASRIVGGQANRLNATHPLTNLTITHTEGIMSHFYGQKVPPRAKPKPEAEPSSS